LGVSDRHYFGWLADALGGFERATGEISAAAAGTRAELWVLAGARMNPAIEIVRDALGAERTAIRFLDRFQRGPDVTAVDVNELGAIPDDACDVLMMTRASYMVQEPRAFLAGLSRIVRPGGLAIVDWIHGAADAPRLDLPGHHEYEGRRHPFVTTYCDPESLADFPSEFEAFIAHVNQPPAWVNVERPGERVPAGERMGRLLAGGPRRHVTLATYSGELRQDLSRAGKHLIEAGELASRFKVLFRHARYMHPTTGKFYLHLLTVLRPVSK